MDPYGFLPYPPQRYRGTLDCSARPPVSSKRKSRQRPANTLKSRAVSRISISYLPYLKADTYDLPHRVYLTGVYLHIAVIYGLLVVGRGWVGWLFLCRGGC